MSLSPLGCGSVAPLRAFISTIDEIVWPALPSAIGATSLALQFQIQRTQWWPPELLRERQFAQLRELIAHAVGTVPFYRDHLRRAGIFTFAGIVPASFRRWPILGRAAVRAAGDALLSRNIPASHGPLQWQSTTGSTGEPVRVACTELDGLFRAAALLRSQFWYGIDTRGKLAAIRPGVRTKNLANWGPPLADMFTTGPMAVLSIAEDIDTQLNWLCDEKPDYLMSLGSNLHSLVLRGRETGRTPAGLRALLSYADRPPDDLATLARETWRIPVHDFYSSAEFGPIAQQCPEHGQLHVQSENLLVEIVDDQGQECAPGQIGRVVVTALHNFATPLIRYDLGDYAVAGTPCACGRGLPVIAAIQGRARNMATDPAGRRFWPMINPDIWIDTPVQQRQFVQHSPGLIEIRYVASRDLSENELTGVTRGLTRNLRYAFEFRFTRVERIARDAGEKFEEFVSLISPT